MATVTLQRLKGYAGAAGFSEFAGGPVTGNSYVIDALGRVTVDVLDAPFFIVKGWCYYEYGAGGSTSPTSGVAVIDFGAFSGSPSASTTIVAGDANDPNAVLDAWIVQVATVDHSADEHNADPPLVGIVADGNGNIIITGQPSGRDLFVQPGVAPGNIAGSQAPVGQTQLMPVGKWSVAWAFSP